MHSKIDDTRRTRTDGRIRRAVSGVFQEWVFQAALLSAVLVAIVDGFSSLSPGMLV